MDDAQDKIKMKGRTKMMIDTTLLPENQTPIADWRWNGYSFQAMNTKVQTWLYSKTDNAILVDVQQMFNSFEKTLSRFIPDSELSRLNAHQQEIFDASPTLLDAVEMALWGAELTSGLYDPTILTKLEHAGYDRSFEQIEHAISPQSAVPFPSNGTDKQVATRSLNYKSVTINRPKREIIKPVAVRLDLGGMGKGWSVDRTADRLQGLGPFLINAGGDIFAYQAPPGKKGWKIDLVHPLNPEQFMGRVILHHRALATSTIAKRRWQHNGQMMHHLINPHTGQPAHTDAISVSVVANRTVMAEIYAKVALILGAEQGLAYLQAVPDVEGIIYTTNNEIVYTNGIPEILNRLNPNEYAT